MNASQLNRRITFEVWESQPSDAGGGYMDVIVDTFSQWAKVEDRTGNQFAAEATNIWNYNTKVTVRKQRVLQSQYTFIYEGFRYKIESLSVSQEAYKEMYIIRASKTDIYIDVS